MNKGEVAVVTWANVTAAVAQDGPRRQAGITHGPACTPASALSVKERRREPGRVRYYDYQKLRIGTLPRRWAVIKCLPL